MPPTSHKRRCVAIVGAGPSGLVAAKSLPMFPGVEELRDYLQSYAKTFDLDQSLRLKTPVRRIERDDGRWRVVTDDGGNTSPVPTAEETRKLRMLVGALDYRAPELRRALQTLERLAAQQR